MRCSSSDTKSSSVSFNDLPIVHDLTFVRGDQVDRKFFLGGICYTTERPTDEDGLLMYHPSETSDESASPIALVAPWEQRYWFSEIRSPYAAAMRYYNGWVPFYGTAPRNWTWWNHYSLKGYFICDATYNAELGGTEVSIQLKSGQSSSIMPTQNSTYNWDLESAYPSVTEEIPGEVEGETISVPVYFDNMKTWISGTVTVSGDWTLNTPQVPVNL
jgi:hypothetical protein